MYRYKDIYIFSKYHADFYALMHVKFIKGLKLLKKEDLKFGLNNSKNFPGVRPPDPSSVTNAIYPPFDYFSSK